MTNAYLDQTPHIPGNRDGKAIGEEKNEFENK